MPTNVNPANPDIIDAAPNHIDSPINSINDEAVAAAKLNAIAMTPYLIAVLFFSFILEGFC